MSIMTFKIAKNEMIFVLRSSLENIVQLFMNLSNREYNVIIRFMEKTCEYMYYNV